MDSEKSFLKIVQSVCNLSCLVIIIVVGWLIFVFNESSVNQSTKEHEVVPTFLKPVSNNTIWKAPDSTTIVHDPDYKLIAYGRELVAHTARYLGPEGKIISITNGMNCQNCHLSAGTRPFGNNYASVASTYPKFRARSGTIESIEKRVNDCIERSLNGRKLDDSSYEMKAFVAYITWVGKEVPKGVTPNGTGIWELTPLNRAANPISGKVVYMNHCKRCHADGTGIKSADNVEWKYPPLFGNDSYTIGAGLYRLSRFAGFVKMNMPYGTTYKAPLLTDEEAWDVAAYINSLPRPTKDISSDWPDISKKPFDHPFGPYADKFSEQQHKFGPFAPIKTLAKK